MATDFHPDTEQTSAAADIDYDVAEGLVSPATAPASDGRVRQEWMMVGIALAALVAVLAIVVSVFAFASSGGSGQTTTIVRHAAAAAPAAAAGPGANSESRPRRRVSAARPRTDVGRRRRSFATLTPHEQECSVSGADAAPREK